MLLTETLAACIAKDYTYTIFRNLLNRRLTPQLKEVLELQGFVELPGEDDQQRIYTVNMSSPCTLIFDARAAIKDPYRQEYLMVRAFQRTRKRLQKALTELYPGNLVLSFDRTMMYEHLIKKICDENGVDTVQTEPRQLGPLMCVPYGDIFKRWILPNTVTKAFHTERYYTPDAKRYQVEAYPHYLNIDTQVETFKSFNRQLILVDDLLDKGYRLHAIQKVLHRKNVEVKKIIVAILSGRGKSMIEGRTGRWTAPTSSRGCGCGSTRATCIPSSAVIPCGGAIPTISTSCPPSTSSCPTLGPPISRMPAGNPSSGSPW